MYKTLGEVIQAMEDNGYEHFTGGWFQYSSHNGPIIAACVMGQGALNLGVDTRSIVNALSKIDLYLPSRIITWNDRQKLDYGDIISNIRGVVEDTKVDLNKKVNLRKETYKARKKV